jgi:hypothetical protein
VGKGQPSNGHNDRHATVWSRRLLHLLPVLLVWLCCALAIANVSADSRDDRRMRAGARLLRSLLAAEVGIEQKVADDGRLKVLVLGARNHNSDEVKRLIAPSDATPANIRGTPLIVEQASRLGQPENLAAIFLTEPLSSAEFQSLMQYANTHGVLVFSLFEGHVERGAHAGLSVEAKVRPYVNARALAAGKISLKPFFMRVAKVHP